MRSYRLAAAAAFLFPTLALAHEGHAWGGFAAGLVHPLTGIDHALSMLAVGVLAAVLGGRARWQLPACFLLVMLLGALLGLQQNPGYLFEIALALCSVAFGVAILFSHKLLMWTAALGTGVVAWMHGHAHGVEWVANTAKTTYVSGFLSGTLLLLAVGLLIGVALQRQSRSFRPAVPLGGSVIALAGLAICLTQLA